MIVFQFLFMQKLFDSSIYTHIQ